MKTYWIASRAWDVNYRWMPVTVCMAAWRDPSESGVEKAGER